MAENDYQMENEDTYKSNVATFLFADEDHTLGNALRFCLSRHPHVVMAGYDVPHPAEERIQVRVQTDGADPTECVIDAAKALGTIADKYLHQLEEIK